MVSTESFEIFVMKKYNEVAREGKYYGVYEKYAVWLDNSYRQPIAIKWSLVRNLQQYEMIVRTFVPKSDETYQKMVANFNALKTLYNYLMTGEE
jgi:hypothetical protein